MVKIGSLVLLFMLFASLGFSSWISGIDYPTCLTPTSVLNYSFTHSIAGSTLGCSVLTTAVPTFSSTGTATVTQTSTTTGNTLNSASSCFSQFYSTPVSCSFTTTSNITYNVSVNGTYNGTVTFAGSASGTGTTSTTVNVSNATASIIITNDTTITITKNGTSVIFSNGTSNLTFLTSILFYISSTGTTGSTYADASASTNVAIYTTPQGILTTTSTEITNSTNTSTYSTPYISIYNATSVIRSDFKSARSYLESGSGTYCRTLLYFNNPYYGNIQLIPRITFVPGVDAWGDFINASDSSAYIPNNTITYVYDSITSIWYIVPAFTCTSYTTVASTSTLQYNPTATGTAPGGSVPIDVYDISGSCSYNTITRLITCTGTDTSGTVTSLNLSAYLSGNTTDLCGNGIGGASGTLTCTLPAQNGTYNVIFYGSDANLFLHQFASKTVVIGSGASGYGKDTYLAVMLIACVAALLLSSNIAVSMVLCCFGLFVALAIGALPLSDAPVAVFFAVIALVLAYRLKV